MVAQLFCLLNRHKPPGRRANWDGETFVSRCAHCHKPIRREGKGLWRLDKENAD